MCIEKRDTWDITLRENKVYDENRKNQIARGCPKSYG